MKRREFILAFAGSAAAAAWPLAARAQQGERVRRVGVLMPHVQNNSVALARIAALTQELQRLGWNAGRNLAIDVRFAGPFAPGIRKQAAELAASAPDVILANGSVAVGPLLEVTRTVPIVFVIVPDPVGGGFVDNLAHPGGNATGFLQFEYGLSGKWLELLKQIAPAVSRAAIMRDPTSPTGTGQFGAIQSVAPALGVEVSPMGINDAREIERAIAAFARTPNGGLIVTGSALAQLHRDLIIGLAARHKLPAVYFERFFVTAGGLVSYGPDLVDQFARAATYIDRILKGEKPADLPVQAPTKYETILNLRTAKALGLDVPPSLLARADEVIE
jgi:putative tryptophan/tyrosine transport system substrate-binding protein